MDMVLDIGGSMIFKKNGIRLERYLYEAYKERLIYF